MNMGPWSALATDRARYAGDAVAVVIADSQARPRARPPNRSPWITRSCPPWPMPTRRWRRARRRSMTTRQAT
jgi:hypothetical protein